MSKELYMIQSKLTSPLASWSVTRATSAATLGLCASLLGCSGDSVNMGENEAEQSALPSTSRCLESTSLEGDVIVRTQADVDALEGCEVIEGDLHIAAFEGADLRPLHALTTVREKLDIGSTEFFTAEDLEGSDAAAAQALQQHWLASLQGLESLESVGALRMTGYAGRDVDPLGNLQHITGGELMIQLNSELERLEGLRNAKGIHNLYVTGCPSLYDIEPLALPEQMTGLSLDFCGVGQLDEPDVHYISGTLRLDHTELRNLDGLSNLTDVGSIYIEANFSLQNVDGLNGLMGAEVMEFEHNIRLTHLPEFSNLHMLDSFRAVFHPLLATLPTFPALYNRSRGVYGEVIAQDPKLAILLQPDLFEVSGNVPVSLWTGSSVPAAGHPLPYLDSTSCYVAANRGRRVRRQLVSSGFQQWGMSSSTEQCGSRPSRRSTSVKYTMGSTPALLQQAVSV
jgi:hypothetical protein